MAKSKDRAKEEDVRPVKEPIAFSGVFEVFDVCSRRLRNGNKLRVVLEAPYEKRQEKRLLDFKYGEARVNLEKHDPEPQLPLKGGDAAKGMTQETADQLKGAGLLG